MSSVDEFYCRALHARAYRLGIGTINAPRTHKILPRATPRHRVPFRRQRDTATSAHATNTVATHSRDNENKQKKEIEKQQKTNESLAMTIDELASLTKIQEVAEQQGLSYNNNNIKTVEEDEE